MKKSSFNWIRLSLISIIASLFALVSFQFPIGLQAEAGMNSYKDSVKAENEKLLALYKTLYADPSMAPPSSFSEGHVSGAQLRDYLEETENGYIIQLPGSTLVPSPAVYKGKVYLSGGFGSKRYYSFDAKTGKNMTAWDIDDDGPSSAAIEDDILVFNTESCTLFAIDIQTGEQLWSWWLGDPLMCMPSISRSKVFTAYPAQFQNTLDQIGPADRPSSRDINEELRGFYYNLSHVLAAFDLKTGKILWQRWIDGDIMSAPVVHGAEVFVTTFAGTLYKFRQSDGELLSVSHIKATSAPVVTRDGIYISRRADANGEQVSEEMARYNQDNIVANRKYNKKIAPYLDKDIQKKSELKSEAAGMDAGNGFTAGAPQSSGWQKAYDMIGQSNVSSLQSFQGSRSLHYMGHNYSTMGNELICADPETGKQVWKINLEGDMARSGGFMGTPPLEVGGYIVIATFSGEIKVVHAKTGKVVTRYNIGDPIRYQPVVYDGWIYVTTTNSRLHAINTGKKELTGWPMWGGNAERTNESCK